MQTCTLPYCDDPAVTRCFLGEDDYRACPHFKAASGDTRQVGARRSEPDNAAPGRHFPWTGNSLGQGTVEFVAGRSPAKLIGVLGAANAGKTTFLSTSYLLLGQGRRLAGRLFAGSYTLLGWENVAADLRIGPWNRPCFPPHTSASGGRQPGMLHLAFRREDGLLEDLLLADAPGEWFTRWAGDPRGIGAEGADWIARNAHAFILLADSEALAGAERGQRVARLRDLTSRVGQYAGDRRVAVVWSKADIEVREEIRGRLRETFRRELPGHREFSVSIRASESSEFLPMTNHLEILHWTLEGEGARVPADLPATNGGSADPFYRYRRRHLG
jgi:Double-GTPase 2